MTSGLVTAVAAIGLFAWDTEKTRGADGNLHGPYSAWQVACLVGVLLLVAVWLGRRREPLLGATCSALGAYVGVIVVGVSAGGEVGAIAAALVGLFVAVAVFGGITGVASLVATLSSRRANSLRARP